MKVIFKNGFIYVGGRFLKGSILVENGKISRLIYDIYELDKLKGIDLTIQCTNNFVLPGFIDPHVHLRGLDQAHKETPETGTLAALKGGVTTLLAMPNTQPPLSTQQTVEQYLKTYPKVYTNVGLIVGLKKGMSAEELRQLKQRGAFGLKIYPGDTNTAFPLEWPVYNYETKRISSIQDEKPWFSLFDLVQELNMPLLFHPQVPIDNVAALAEFEEQLELSRDKKNPTLHAHSAMYSILNENLIIEFLGKLFRKYAETRETFPQVHFCHISNPDFIYHLLDNMPKEMNIIKEVTPHHLFLNYNQTLPNSTHGKVLCPLRSPETQIRLFSQFENLKFDVVGTDHAPHTPEEKARPFLDAPAGFPSIELLAPLLMTAVFDKKIYLSQVVFNCSTNVAKVFGIPQKGKLETGYDADFILVEKTAPYTIKPEELLTKSKISPYISYKLRAQVTKTIIAGKIAFDRKTQQFDQYGRYLFDFDEKAEEF